MKQMLYYFGRGLQLTGLIAMPAAIWIAEVRHSEAEAISVFLGSFVVFYLGWLLIRNRGK